MQKRVRLSAFSLPCLLTLPLAILADVAEDSTPRNLEIAYSGESNARAKYLEFAKRADSEDNGKVASLFHAAAESEQIHRDCAAAALKKLNVRPPDVIIQMPPVKSTRQNLLDSTNEKGEVYEGYTMYPDFARTALHDGNQEAARCFSYAQTAEAEHFNLFIAAAADLDNMKGNSTTFYVCKEGGYTMRKLDAAKCRGKKYLKAEVTSALKGEDSGKSCWQNRKRALPAGASPLKKSDT